LVNFILGLSSLVAFRPLIDPIRELGRDFLFILTSD